MAEAGSQEEVSVFHHHKCKVEVSCADISKVTADAVIIENNGKSELPEETKLIYHSIPILNQISKESTYHEKITVSRTCGLQVKFGWLFHVCVNAYSKENKDVWIKHMNEIYAAILKIANKRKSRSLAMPLLSGGAPTEVAVETLVRSIAAYKPVKESTLREFNIVTLDRQFTNKIISLCEKIFRTFPDCCHSKPKTSEDVTKQKILERTNAKHDTQNLKQKHSGYITVGNIDNKHTNDNVKDNETKLNPSKISNTVKTSDNSPIKNLERKVDAIGPIDEDKTKSGQSYGENGDSGVLSSLLNNDKNDTAYEGKEGDEETEEEGTKGDEGTEEEGDEGTEEEASGRKLDEKVTEDKTQDDVCVICMDTIVDKKRLDKCGHEFCRACIDKCFQTFKPICPSCNTVYGVIVGDQPSGSMNVSKSSERVPGYGNGGAIVINYSFADGIQSRDHPHPGKRYHGTQRTAYLPDNTEGNKVLRLLQLAFDRKLTFTVGRSATTGMEDVVIWNDVHHKTSIHGGPQGFGYPDETYLARVQEELASKGVTIDSLNS